MALIDISKQGLGGARPSVVAAWPVCSLGFPSFWRVWLARKRYRDDLKRLLRVGPHMVADLGLALDDAQAEMAKPFWRA